MHMIFLIWSILAGHIDTPTSVNARNVGALATLQSTVTSQAAAFYAPNLAMAVQIDLQNHVHMPIANFIGTTLPTSLNLR